jgi:hypothetical protein
MSRRLSRLLLPALMIAAVFPGMAPGGPTAPAGNLTCTMSPASPDVNIVTTGVTSTRVDANAGLVCYGNANHEPQPDGMGSRTPGGGPPTVAPNIKAGDPCQYGVTLPVRFTIGSPNGPSNIGWLYARGGPFSDPSFNGLNWNQFSDLALDAGSNAVAQSTWTEAAQGTDFFIPFTFHGFWEPDPKNGGQLTCSKPDPNFNTFKLVGGGFPGWTSPCPGPTGWQVPQCLVSVINRPVITPGQAQADIPVTLQGVNLAGLLQGHFNGGQITSTPATPHPGLVNSDTCFFVTNLTADGQPVATDTGVVASFAFTRMDPNAFDAKGHHVVFTFRIDVNYNGSTWNFGDGVNPPIFQSAKGQPCDTAGPAAQVSADYKYTKYSLNQPGGTYQVSVQHHFGIHVTAMWLDTMVHTVDLGSAGVNDVPVSSGSENIQIVQEEGVPIG